MIERSRWESKARNDAGLVTEYATRAEVTRADALGQTVYDNTKKTIRLDITFNASGLEKSYTETVDDTMSPLVSETTVSSIALALSRFSIGFPLA